ncbi:MAG TPA: AI-2E family transporter [Acidimicrobiales bacterium]|nr:AI-2E family transporter [Acidimicrobiales bacterium]
MAEADLRRPARRARLRLTPRSVVMAVGALGLTLALLRVIDASKRVIGWILVAGVLAGLLHPIVTRLERHMRRGVAVGLVMLTLVGGAGAVVYGLVDDVQTQTRRLQEAAPERAAKLEQSRRFGEIARDLDLEDRTRRFVDEVPERLRGGTPAEAIRAAATRGVAYLATGVLTVFFLLHGPRIGRAARDQLRDPARRERLNRVGRAVYGRAFGYAGASLTMAVAAGLFSYALARAADVPGPAPLAIWVGLWDLVPLAGVVVGAAPIVGLAAAASGERALVLALAFVSYQLVENLVVQRRVEAATVHLGPFVTLAAGLVGLELSGVAGALLLVLAAAILTVAADEVAAP